MIKMTPEQLKASILQYAMEGKLVKQDSNDEPASILLEKIKAEKEKLVKEGKIKKSKKLHAIEEDEKPFDIPDSWEWVRLEGLATFINGFAYKSKNYVKISKNQVIRLGNVKNNRLLVSAKPVYIDDEYAESTSQYRILDNDILFTMTGTRKKRDYFFTLIVKQKDLNSNRMFLNQRVGCLRYILCDPDWLNYILKSPLILDEVFENETGTANQGNIGSTKTMGILIPLPPLEEQKRIVAKIEKLMPLVDKYAEAYNRLKKIDDEFDDRLKQSILQYSMEGKLVKQNPDDEPASVLLEKIKTEKEKLIQEGKIKKTKKLPEITDEEKPFDIPDGWKWVRIKEIGYLQTGTTPSIGKNNYLGNYIPFIKPGDIYEDRINYKNQALSEKGLKNGRLIEKHSILTVCIGSIGKSYVTDRPVSCNQQINTITPLQHVYYKYILACINSRIVQQSLWKKASKTTLPIVNRTKLSSIVIPLPPLEEQKRIVAKIEKLDYLINQL